MKDEKKNEKVISLSEETSEENKLLVENTFRLFADQIKQITEDVAEFNEKRQLVRERIKRGARRRSGHIV